MINAQVVQQLVFFCVALLGVAHAAQLNFEASSGWWDGRHIAVKGTLYRDGTLAAEVKTESKHFLRACRGGAVAIGVDDNGRKLFAVELKGQTACSQADLFCSSTQRKAHMVHLGAEEAATAVTVQCLFDYDYGSLQKRAQEAMIGISDVYKQGKALIDEF